MCIHADAERSGRTFAGRARARSEISADGIDRMVAYSLGWLIEVPTLIQSMRYLKVGEPRLINIDVGMMILAGAYHVIIRESKYAFILDF
jgi:hypothetical protein